MCGPTLRFHLGARVDPGAIAWWPPAKDFVLGAVLPTVSSTENAPGAAAIALDSTAASSWWSYIPTTNPTADGDGVDPAVGGGTIFFVLDPSPSATAW